MNLPLTASPPYEHKEEFPRVPYAQLGPPRRVYVPPPAMPQPVRPFWERQDQFEEIPEPESLARAESGEDLEALVRRANTPESRRFTVDEFQYPEDWKTFPRYIDTDIDQYTNLLNTAQCYDFLESNDIRFAEYLVEDPTDNIILIAPPPINSPPDTLGTTAICTRRSELARTLTDLSAIALPCVGQSGTTFPPDASARFVRLALGNFNIFVPEREVRIIALNPGRFAESPKIYQAEPTDLNIPVTASVDAILNLHYVSADHCQEGTQKTIYHLRPVLSRKLSNFMPETFKEEESKRQLECKEDWTPGNYEAQYLGECGIGERYNLGNVEAFQEPYGETLLNLSQPEFKRRNREIERNCLDEQGQFVPGDYPTRRMSQCLTPAHLQNLSEEEYNTLEDRVRQSCIDTQMDYTRGNYTAHQLGHCVATGEPYELGQVEALRTEEEQKQLEEQRELEEQHRMQQEQARFLANEREIYESCNSSDEVYVPGVINVRPGRCFNKASIRALTLEQFRNMNNEIQQACVTYGHGFVPGVVHKSLPRTMGRCVEILPGEAIPTFNLENSVLTDQPEARMNFIAGREFIRGL